MSVFVIMAITGMAEAIVFREKKIRLLSIYASGLVLSVLLELLRGYTSFLPELLLTIMNTLIYILGYQILRIVLDSRVEAITSQGRRRLLLMTILFFAAFAAMIPAKSGTVTYQNHKEGRNYVIDYRNARAIWDYLRDKLGCSRAAASGILGNMFAESEYQPEIIEDNGVGHGIGQWSWDRWYGEDGLQIYAERNGENWDDMKLQLSFLKHEIVEKDSMGAYYDGGFKRFKKLREVEGEEGSAHVFFFSFEYGAYMSNEEFLSDEFEEKFATRSKRLAVAKKVYDDKRRFP